MRGYENQQQQMFSYVNLEQRVPQNHPLRKLKGLVNQVLDNISPYFDLIYSDYGCPSIPPEQLLRGFLIQIFYTIRSERQLVEHIDANLWYRWFVGLGIDDEVWNHSTYSKNRDRLLEHDVAKIFFEEVLNLAREHKLLSDEHFTVDGTLIESMASLKSFKPKDKNPKPPNGKNDDVNFRGEQRKNDTHQSTTDPESMLYRKGKGKEAKLSYMGQLTMENRNGLAVEACATKATGTAERDSSLEMIDQVKSKSRSKSKKITLGGDKNYDVAAYTKALKEKNVTPHVAQNDTNRKSSIDGRTTRHAGYETSSRKRKLVEEIFGWMKTIGGIKRLRHKGLQMADWTFTFTTAAYNLVRMIKLVPA
jgi:transposase